MSQEGTTHPASMVTADNAVICQHCNSPIGAAARFCPTCYQEAGYPNVRAAKARDEVAALDQRYHSAKSDAETSGASSAFASFVTLTQSSSHVIVAAPPIVALALLRNTSNLYANYSQLVDSEARSPAEHDDDCLRLCVDARLFGSYHNKIKCGALALSDVGLLNYGRVFLKMKPKAISHRTSFLSENSYTFVGRLSSSTDPPPLGYLCSWSTRGKLAGAKLGEHITSRSTSEDWPQLLLTPGNSRSDDDFIEAHIFGPFDVNAIQSMHCHYDGASRADTLTLRAVEELSSALCP